MSGYQSPFRAVIMDRGRTMVAECQDCISPRWSWIVPGGCDRASFSLPREYEDIGAWYEYRVDLYFNGAKVWAGFIDTFSPSLDEQGNVPVDCVGYGEALKQRIIASFFTNGVDASSIMSQNLANYIALGSPSPLYDMITGSITSAGFSPAAYKIEQRQLGDVVNELALMGQTGGGVPYEWKVDETRTFTYSAPTTSANRWCRIGGDVMHFAVDRGPMSEVKNSLYVTGNLDDTGTFATGTFQDSTSISTFGRKDGVIQLTGLNTQAAMQKAATAILTRVGFPQDRAAITLINNNDLTFILSFEGGEMLEVRGFTDGSVFTGRVMSVEYALTERGLENTMSLNALTANFNDLFLSAANAKSAAILAEVKRQAAGGGTNVVGFPWAIGKAAFFGTQAH